MLEPATLADERKSNVTVRFLAPAAKMRLLALTPILKRRERPLNTAGPLPEAPPVVVIIIIIIITIVIVLIAVIITTLSVPTAAMVLLSTMQKTTIPVSPATATTIAVILVLISIPTLQLMSRII